MASSRNMVFGGCRALMAAAKAASSSSSSSSTSTVNANAKGLLKVVPVSPQLSKFLGGDSEASRTHTVKKVWEYIKLHNLQNPANKKEIRCDEKLKTIFDGKDTVGFPEIARLLSQHFKKSS